MFHVHSPRVPATIAAVAALAAVAAGCSNGGGTPAHTTGAHKAATSTQAGPVYTAAELRGALLTTLDGVKPAVPVEAGLYGDLPGVKATRASLNGVKITPAKCATASSTGLASPKFNQVPATVTTFRDGVDGVSEVLLSPPSALMDSALTHAIPAGCAEYHARVGAHTYTYRVRQETAPSLGTDASELNVKAFGSDSANIWTVIYRTTGLVGAVTLVGQDASKADADTLAEMAYEHAEKMLA
jgi:hypothetical protein